MSHVDTNLPQIADRHAACRGVDSSTSATKVEVRDLDSGEVVGRGSSPHPPTQPPRSEQDPAAWWAAFESAWEQAGSPDVAAISVGGQQHGMVALDDAARGHPPGQAVERHRVGPGCRLAHRAAAGWPARRGPTRAVRCRWRASPITKLAWLRRNEPEAFDRLAHVVLPHDWLTFRLTGSLTTDRGDASGTGYWSAASGTYRDDLLALVDADRDWSTVAARPCSVRATWRGSGEGRRVGPGTGDNMAGALGVGLRSGDVAVSIGTSGTVYSVCDSPSADPSGIVAGFADATGRHLPLVCTLNATKVTDAVARLLGVDHEEFDELVFAAPPGAGGLTCSRTSTANARPTGRRRPV